MMRYLLRVWFGGLDYFKTSERVARQAPSLVITITLLGVTYAPYVSSA
jgi:hypothetical protein